MKKLSLQGWRARPKDTIAVFPSVYTVAYATGRKCLKQYGAKLKSMIYVLGKEDMDIFMETQADYRRFSGLLVKKFKKQPRYLDSLIEWSEKNVDLLYDFVSDKFDPEIIRRLSNIEIAKRYNQYIERYLTYHLKNTPAWWIGALAAEKELNDYLSARFPAKDGNALLSAIIDPLEYRSENFNEEISLLDIAIDLRKINRRNINSIADWPESVKNKFQRHCLTYTSLPFGYKTGLVWTEKDFLKRLRTMLKADPAASKKLKLGEIKEKIIVRDRILNSLRLPGEIKNLVQALRKLAYLQELKKTMQTRSHPALQLVIKKEIARRLGLEIKYLDYLSDQEIGSLLKSGRAGSGLKKELASRESFSVLIIRNMKYSWLTGRVAKQFIKTNGLLLDVSGVKEIRGQAASPGRVKGRVKICQYSTEINKIKTGDILVTAMTTPDFVPAMRKAAAIVTDEGGITSHAAIVARELGKPCIIGAKVAAKVLHDGDLVEVDADKGIIRKL